ncbi:leucine-rich repeat-containing protein 4-like [Branchiostoma lanceolatum]|uniref:leucine-rich repeat-containing protein 4-like n=1 Tax=Branchiostoma lanceolatum TaxID=7740 RepID=UPI00345231D2
MFKPLEAWFPMILLLYPTAGQWDCPKICECSEFAQSVYCGEKFLSTMPIGIPRDVKILVLHRNNFTKLVKDQFSYLPYLTKLDLGQNSITEIQVGAFQGLTRLLDLLLHQNQLLLVTPEMFSPLSNLQLLRLYGNPIICLDAYTFSTLPLLRFLDLEQLGTLRSVSRNVFTGLTSLTYLNFARSNLQTVPYLQHLTSLEELVLIGNSITILSAKNFAGLTKLKRLNMSKNRLLEIEQGTFDDLTTLQELDLSYNNLSGLPYGLFSNMAALQSLRLQYNPWNCSCQIKWLNQFLRTHVGNGGTNICGNCKIPRRYEGVLLCDTALEKMPCSPPLLEAPSPNATLNVSVGESAALQCNVNAKNEKDSSISWTKPDGSSVRPGTFRFRVKLTKAGTRLNISRVTMSDAGIYRCVARNSEGSATFDTILNVTGSILPINKATEIPMLEEPIEDDFDSSLCAIPQDRSKNNGSQLQRDIGSDVVKWPPTTDSLDITNTPTYSEGTGREGVNRKTYVVGLVGAVAGLVVVLWIVFCLATKCSRMKRRRRCRKKAQQDIKGCMRRSSCLDNNSKPEDIVEIPDIHTITGKGLYDHENITVNPTVETIV